MVQEGQAAERWRTAKELEAMQAHLQHHQERMKHEMRRAGGVVFCLLSRERARGLLGHGFGSWRVHLAFMQCRRQRQLYHDEASGHIACKAALHQSTGEHQMALGTAEELQAQLGTIAERASQAAPHGSMPSMAACLQPLPIQSPLVEAQHEASLA